MPSTPRRKRCRFCKDLFAPDPRLKSRQISCSKPDCQKARKKANQELWLERHPEYFKGRYPKVKRWLEAHPRYLAEYRRANPQRVRRDHEQRKERHRLAQKAHADMQDSISLQSKILQRLTPYLAAAPNADIQNSLWPQVVVISIFSSRFAQELSRRYTRLDRPAGPPPLPSAQNNSPSLPVKSVEEHHAREASPQNAD